MQAKYNRAYLSFLRGRYSESIQGFDELRQYYILCVQFPMYELVSEGLLRALQILKNAPVNP